VVAPVDGVLSAGSSWLADWVESEEDSSEERDELDELPVTSGLESEERGEEEGGVCFWVLDATRLPSAERAEMCSFAAESREESLDLILRDFDNRRAA